MNKAITKSKSSLRLQGEKAATNNLSERLNSYLSLLAGAVVFALLILSSISNGNLLLSELLTVAFIVLGVLVIAATHSPQQRGFTIDRIRDKRKENTK